MQMSLAASICGTRRRLMRCILPQMSHAAVGILICTSTKFLYRMTLRGRLTFQSWIFLPGRNLRLLRWLHPCLWDQATDQWLQDRAGVRVTYRNSSGWSANVARTGAGCRQADAVA